MNHGVSWFLFPHATVQCSNYASCKYLKPHAPCPELSTIFYTGVKKLDTFGSPLVPAACDPCPIGMLWLMDHKGGAYGGRAPLLDRAALSLSFTSDPSLAAKIPTENLKTELNKLFFNILKIFYLLIPSIAASLAATGVG